MKSTALVFLGLLVLSSHGVAAQSLELTAAQKREVIDSLRQAVEKLRPFNADELQSWGKECDTLNRIALNDTILASHFMNCNYKAFLNTDNFQGQLISFRGWFRHKDWSPYWVSRIDTEQIRKERHRSRGNVTWANLDHGCGWLLISGAKGIQTVEQFDSILNCHRAAKGILLDVRGLHEMQLDTLVWMLGRLANHPIPGIILRRSDGLPGKYTDQELAIKPRGEWQYNKPMLVIYGGTAISAIAAACLENRPDTKVQYFSSGIGTFDNPDTDLMREDSVITLPYVPLQLHISRERVLHFREKTAVLHANTIMSMTIGCFGYTKDEIRRQREWDKEWKGVIKKLYKITPRD